MTVVYRCSNFVNQLKKETIQGKNQIMKKSHELQKELELSGYEVVTLNSVLGLQNVCTKKQILFFDWLILTQ